MSKTPKPQNKPVEPEQPVIADGEMDEADLDEVSGGTNQETQQSYNLQYLQLQNQMQAENRSYTAVSNIVKDKNVTTKNSISNIR